MIRERSSSPSVRRCGNLEPMPQFGASALHWLLGTACAVLVACDDSGSPPSDSTTAGTMNAAGSGATAGSSSGGAAGSSGASSAAGAAGTGTGGSGGGGGGGAGGGGSAGGGAGGASNGGSGNCNGALFCDDFESYSAMPGAPWTIKKNAQGTVVIDGAQHKSGTKAVKFSLSGAAAYQQAYIGVESPFPIAGNAFYGRMMIYIAAAPNDGVHWTMIQGEGPEAAHSIERAQVRYGGQQMERLMANYDSSGPKSDCWKHSQTKMPEGQWACMEWYFDGATNTQKFWLDETAIEDLTVTGQGEGCVSDETGGKWYFPSFQRLYVGWESYQTDDPREVWIDDVAIGTSQIGCPQ
jgi:hypothetical protein